LLHNKITQLLLYIFSLYELFFSLWNNVESISVMWLRNTEQAKHTTVYRNFVHVTGAN